MGRYTGNACRLLTMITLTSTFFLVEIIVGYATNSLALVSDSYHMLSDVVALLVGFASIRISEWHSAQNTYGWVRAEVLGAFVNAVFLTALCFTIFIEALQRLAHESEITNPDLLFVIGGTGLFVNIIGIVLFSGIAHGHSHGNGSINGNGSVPSVPSKVHRLQPNYDEHTITVDNTGQIMESQSGQARKAPDMDSSAKLNMRGVFLHVVGDALGSVIVVISAAVIKYGEGDWKYKVDPIMSLVMVAVIMVTTVPLLKASALVLLQTVPFHIQVRKLQERLLLEVPGVNAVHEFHVWQLAGNRIIASAHILCHDQADYMRIASDVKRFFHNEGIHSTTIQPEFVDNIPLPEGMYCVFDCPDQMCDMHTCCGSMKQQLFIHDVQPNYSDNNVQEDSIPGSVLNN